MASDEILLRVEELLDSYRPPASSSTRGPQQWWNLGSDSKAPESWVSAAQRVKTSKMLSSSLEHALQNALSSTTGNRISTMESALAVLAREQASLKDSVNDIKQMMETALKHSKVPETGTPKPKFEHNSDEPVNNRSNFAYPTNAQIINTAKQMHAILKEQFFQASTVPDMIVSYLMSTCR